MKKTFFILILFLFLSVKANADGNYTPQWSEFCPYEYSSTEYIDYNQLKPSQKAGYLLKKFVFPGKDYIMLNNYWVDRRNDFVTEINFCNEIPEITDRTGCYIQIGKVQREETKAFYEIQALQREVSYERSQNSYYRYKR